MKDLTFTAVDCETANNSRNSICQIGITKVEQGHIVSSNSFLVQPPNNEYSSWNSCIHGISPDQTNRAPFFVEIWKLIKDYFENQLIVAHNADFDVDCLQETLEYYDIQVPIFNIECTYKATGLNLVDLCESLQIPIIKHHNAEYDALACAKAYILLHQGIKPNHKLITIKGKKSIFEGHEKLCGDVLKPDFEKADPRSPFRGKKIVFTGVLSSITREEAAKVTKEMGADIDTGISKKTDYVVVGSGAGPSKLKKIEEFNKFGSMIKILHEMEFIDLLKLPE